MKNLIFICSILIILFKTGNVLSNNNIFNVNNIEIENVTPNSREIQVNKAFQKAFDQLINRLLLKKDYQKFKNLSFDQVKKLVSYYQIINTDTKNIEKNNFFVNVFFDRERVHNFFYSNNILFSDIIDTEVILFPLLNIEKKIFIYSQNYFYDNWNNQELDYLAQYTLPVENIENYLDGTTHCFISHIHEDHFDLNARKKTSLIPKNYSVLSSQYDYLNDFMYVKAKHDTNGNGKRDITEPIHIFWISLKDPKQGKRAY